MGCRCRRGGKASVTGGVRALAEAKVAKVGSLVDLQ